MAWIAVTSLTGRPAHLNGDMLERVRHPDAGASPEAGATIDLQSGKSEHVVETPGEIMARLKAAGE